MKQAKLFAIGLVFLAFVVFFTMRPLREKACPLTKANLTNDPQFAIQCTEAGAVVKDGKCTCPE
jgi:hypothetical protein